LNARATTRYIGAGAIIVTKGDNLVAIALAHGLAIGLMFVVFGAVDKRGPATIAGLAIGVTIMMDIFAGGPISGAAMNPARTLGPALVQNVWNAGWIYWVGPIVGAVIAALVYTYFLLDESSKDETVDLPQE
jgi:glycerol uptake facilitator-like aquaporin